MPSMITSVNENCMSITSALEVILSHPSLLYLLIIPNRARDGYNSSCFSEICSAFTDDDRWWSWPHSTHVECCVSLVRK